MNFARMEEESETHVFERQSASNIPTGPTNIDPSNLYLKLSLARCGILEEGNRLVVGHPPKTSPDGRAIRNFNQATLSDVSVAQERGVLTDVDTRFCTRSSLA